MYPDLRSQQIYNVTPTTIWKEGQDWMVDKEQCIREALDNEPTVFDRFGGPDLMLTVRDGNYTWEIHVDTAEMDCTSLLHGVLF